MSVEKIKEYAKNLRLLYILNHIDDELAKKRNLSSKTEDFLCELLRKDIVQYGNPGTSKTHLAIGLGIHAAEAGYSVKFYSVPTLVNRLKELKMQKSLLSIQKHFENIDLLILDELGYISFDREGGELLLIPNSVSKFSYRAISHSNSIPSIFKK